MEETGILENTVSLSPLLPDFEPGRFRAFSSIRTPVYGARPDFPHLLLSPASATVNSVTLRVDVSRALAYLLLSESPFPYSLRSEFKSGSITIDFLFLGNLGASPIILGRRGSLTLNLAVTERALSN